MFSASRRREKLNARKFGRRARAGRPKIATAEAEKNTSWRDKLARRLRQAGEGALHRRSGVQALPSVGNNRGWHRSALHGGGCRQRSNANSAHLSIMRARRGTCMSAPRRLNALLMKRNENLAAWLVCHHGAGRRWRRKPASAARPDVMSCRAPRKWRVRIEKSTIIVELRAGRCADVSTSSPYRLECSAAQSFFDDEAPDD